MDNQAVALVPFNIFEQFAQKIISEEIKKAMTTFSVAKEEQLLTRKELAERLDVTTATISTYKSEGMPHRMVKRRPYFLYSEVERYMDLRNKKTKKK